MIDRVVLSSFLLYFFCHTWSSGTKKHIIVNTCDQKAGELGISEQWVSETIKVFLENKSVFEKWKSLNLKKVQFFFIYLSA